MPATRRSTWIRLGVLALALAAGAASAQPAGTVRLRGNTEAVTDTRLTLRERGGQRIELALPANLVVTEMFPVALADVKPGSFIGAGATPVVSLRPGDRSLLVVGGAVSLSAQEVNGQPTATHISAGRNGFAPPY